MKRLLLLLLFVPFVLQSQIADTTLPGKVYKEIQITRSICILDTNFSVSFRVMTYFISDATSDTILIDNKKYQPVVDIRDYLYLKQAFYTNTQLQAVNKFVKQYFKTLQ